MGKLNRDRLAIATMGCFAGALTIIMGIFSGLTIGAIGGAILGSIMMIYAVVIAYQYKG